MKILLLSDTHRDIGRIARLLSLYRDVDLIVHCGDLESDCDYIKEQAPHIPFHAVCGNNDFWSLCPDSLTDELDGHRVYITHGHREHVKSGYGGLIAAAKAKNCTLVFYGHTHRAVDVVQDGIRLINPGALCSGAGFFALITCQNGQIDVKHLTLED